jgi:hypothetical protein
MREGIRVFRGEVPFSWRRKEESGNMGSHPKGPKTTNASRKGAVGAGK